MNNLMWALLSILSMEVYQSFGHEEDLYQDMLDLFAPKSVSKLTGQPRNKTSSKMDTREMAVLLDGIFRTLAENGTEVSDGFDIDKYWTDFYKWRGEQEGDPLADQFESIEEYRRGVVFCEACRLYVGGGEGQVAHIVGKGAGGADYSFNLLRLCTGCHITIQHQHGWRELLETAPHLEWKVNRAHELQKKSAPGENAEEEQLGLF